MRPVRVLLTILPLRITWSRSDTSMDSPSSAASSGPVPVLPFVPELHSQHARPNIINSLSANFICCCPIGAHYPAMIETGNRGQFAVAKWSQSNLKHFGLETEQLKDSKEASIRVMCASAKSPITAQSRQNWKLACLCVCFADCGWLAHLHL